MVTRSRNMRNSARAKAAAERNLAAQPPERIASVAVARRATRSFPGSLRRGGGPTARGLEPVPVIKKNKGPPKSIEKLKKKNY